LGGEAGGEAAGMEAGASEMGPMAELLMRIGVTVNPGAGVNGAAVKPGVGADASMGTALDPGASAAVEGTGISVFASRNGLPPIREREAADAVDSPVDGREGRGLAGPQNGLSSLFLAWVECPKQGVLKQKWLARLTWSLWIQRSWQWGGMPCCAMLAHPRWEGCACPMLLLPRTGTCSARFSWEPLLAYAGPQRGLG
ncbi:hypothetical protein CLOP_g16070, partial [Closterium sp. NIES-67]